MKASKLLYLFLPCMFISCKHEPSCDDFKEGTFLQTVLDKKDVRNIITRTLNTQESYRIEEHGKRINSENFHSTIEWVNDCDYYLKIDTSKVKNDKDVDEINRNGGYFFKFIQFDGECALYNVTLKLDHETLTFHIRSCKL